MAEQQQAPISDSVSKVNGEVAVGEDLEFQRRWWRFEKVAWWFFVFLLAVDLSGLFGRGPLAKADATAADGTMHVHYERIERNSTPSILRVEFSATAIHNGEIRLYTSNSLQTGLGAQRVVPAPARTEVGDGGLTYTFPATRPPASVEFAVEPDGPGLRHLLLRVEGGAPVKLDVLVMP